MTASSLSSFHTLSTTSAPSAGPEQTGRTLELQTVVMMRGVEEQGGVLPGPVEQIFTLSELLRDYGSLTIQAACVCGPGEGLRPGFLPGPVGSDWTSDKRRTTDVCSEHVILRLK